MSQIEKVQALINRIESDAFPGFGDLSEQCLESLDALKAMVARPQDAETFIYRYRVIGDPQGWEYSPTPLFGPESGPESGPGPKEEYQILTLDQAISELNDARPVEDSQ